MFAPLIDTLRAAGCRLVEAETVTGRALASGSWLFLGDSSRRRSLFAAPPAKVDGFTLEEARQAGIDFWQALKTHGTSEPLWKLGSGVAAKSNVSALDLRIILIQ